MRTLGFAFSVTALEALEGFPHKIRRQVIKKAKALMTQPYPPGCKKLVGIETDMGEGVFRERTGDYRILYIVRDNPAEVLILDIDHRKDVYKMPKTNTNEEMKITEERFDEMMKGALGAGQPKDAPKSTKKEPAARKA
jgi:mRNA interferase RelE/StbE